MTNEEDSGDVVPVAATNDQSSAAVAKPSQAGSIGAERPWIERHPVLVGLIAAGLGGLIGGLGTAAIKFAEVKASSDAAVAWSAEFNNWKTAKESASKNLLDGITKDYDRWLEGHKARIAVDLNTIRTSNNEAIRVATKAESTANAVDADCEAATSELARLLELSKAIGKNTGDLPKQVRDLLVADIDALARPLAKVINAQAPPIGAVIAWPIKIDNKHPCPPGWHECDGTPLNTSDYRELKQAIGSTYGDLGADKVALPDFQGMFLRGVGGTGEHKSSDIGKRQADQVGNHQHEFEIDAAKLAIPNYSQHIRGREGDQIKSVPVKGTTAHMDPAETRPVSYAINWIIRVK